jgi:hypothetical protein
MAWVVAWLCTRVFWGMTDAAVHGDATQLPQDRVELHRERLPAWRRAGQRQAAWHAELCGFPGDRAVGDEPITWHWGQTGIAALPRRHGPHGPLVETLH